MLKKGSKLNSILTGSCPKCQNERMYEVKNPYKLNTTLKMNETCSQCGTRYKIEPSFFYGAMYVSYGVGIAFAVAAFIITRYFIGSESLLTSFFAIMGTQLIPAQHHSLMRKNSSCCFHIICNSSVACIFSHANPINYHSDF